jgi:hypothetical protein
LVSKQLRQNLVDAPLEKIFQLSIRTAGKAADLLDRNQGLLQLQIQFSGE